MHAAARQDPEHARPTVVLLRDGRWPDEPGVCCLRHGVRAAFTAAGATVGEVTVPLAAPQARQEPLRSRIAWLPRRIRSPLRRVQRRARATVAQVRRRLRRPIPGLADASLIIAESLEAADAAVASGVSADRVWAMVLPPERLPSDSEVGLAADLATMAGLVGGFLTDSEPARDEVERATSALRPRVRLFPPLAVDRSCPTCASWTGGSASDPDALPEVGQLRLWRTMLAGDRTVDPSAQDLAGYGFAVARLLGPSAAWPPPGQRTAWGQASPPASADAPAAAGGAGWSAAVQDRTAHEILRESTPQAPAKERGRRSALLAGYDLKFARELADRLAKRTDLAVTIDDWPELGRGTSRTRMRLRRADSIFAEWARTSAVWLSHHKRPGQFLAVRLHRFELDAPYPRQIAIDNVDAVVYIAPLFGRRIRDELGWPARKLVYIPNYIDVDSLDRPKLPDARFAIGFVGVEWSRKRFDLALDLIAALRRQEPRFTLVVRSVMPWHNKFAWANPKERAYATACFNRIQQDPYLRGGVIFEPPGRDMARWLRGIGHILSTSDEEGSHTSVTEGMASGAVPVVRPWPGASELYGEEWISPSLADAVATLLDTADDRTWAERSARARSEARQTHNPEAVVEAWADLLHGEIDNARKHFAEFSPLTG